MFRQSAAELSMGPFYVARSLAGFCRHVVGKTWRNVCYCDISLKYVLLVS